jgi:hypothetical protein
MIYFICKGCKKRSQVNEVRTFFCTREMKMYTQCKCSSYNITICSQIDNVITTNFRKG